MSVSVSKVPLFSSGQISFSSLRTSFKETSDGEMKASELLRNTTSLNSSPILPDATENSAVSSGNDWKTSQLRNTVKEYILTQTGTDLNLDIADQSWNDNLSKTIRKTVIIDGTCGSNDASISSLILSSTAYNLTIDVNGQILGAAGRGGNTGSGAPSISGQNGGNAITITSDGIVNVIARESAQIYGGGGGGERGRDGRKGNDGRCTGETTTQGCGGAPGCPGGYNDAGSWGGGCCQSTCDWCWGCCERCVNWIQYRRCKKDEPRSGGAGGTGGVGGIGRGYNNQLGSLAGAGGSAGGSGAGCGAQNGQNGETGGSGGEWGVSGSNTNNSGNGGSNGAAVGGTNFILSGTINSSTVKGNYR